MWEEAGGGIDRVVAAVSFTLSAEVEQLELAGTAALNGTGNELGNLLLGNAAANRLSGLPAMTASPAVRVTTRWKAAPATTPSMAAPATMSMSLTSAGDVLVEAVGGGTDLVRAAVDWRSAPISRT